MSIEDRKIREKEAFRKLVIDASHNIMIKEGLEGLTIRALANSIEYSQFKIYEVFKNKDQIYEVLCKDMCETLLELLKKIPRIQDSEQFLMNLILKTTQFHSSYPHSDELFTLVCFGPERFETPHAFLEIEKCFASALCNLNSPYIQSNEEVLDALDIIRCIFIGVSNLMVSETSLKGKTRALEMTENALKVLLRGWRK